MRLMCVEKEPSLRRASVPAGVFARQRHLQTPPQIRRLLRRRLPHRLLRRRLLRRVLRRSPSRRFLRRSLPRRLHRRLPRSLLRRLPRRTTKRCGRARIADARTRRRISAGGRESRVLGRALHGTGEAGLTNRDGRSLTRALPLFRTRLGFGNTARRTA